jgi:hypothetical protein
MSSLKPGRVFVSSTGGRQMRPSEMIFLSVAVVAIVGLLYLALSVGHTIAPPAV